MTRLDEIKYLNKNTRDNKQDIKFHIQITWYHLSYSVAAPRHMTYHLILGVYYLGLVCQVECQITLIVCITLFEWVSNCEPFLVYIVIKLTC